MNNLGLLYRFELKKIFRKRIVWISVAIALLSIPVGVGNLLLGSYNVDKDTTESRYQGFQKDRAYQKALDGRAIDQTLLEEMQEAYGKVPLDADSFMTTKEYQTYARPYDAIFDYVRATTYMTVSEARQWEADEQDLNQKKQNMLEKLWNSYYLTAGEKEFWQQQEQRLERPVIFRYLTGYSQLFDNVNTAGLITLVVTAVCLSGFFTEEHTRKTDQLILSSRYGRKPVYWAKFLAGISFSAIISVMFVVASFVTAYGLYGPEGFSAVVQLMRPGYSYSLSAGQAILIAYGMITAAGILVGAFVMMLSELLKSSVGTLAVVVGAILFTLFVNVPDNYRVLSQLWSYLPSEYVAVWNLFNPQTVPLFGNYLVSWQVVPILYALLGCICAFIGRRVFVRYQVSGR